MYGERGKIGLITLATDTSVLPEFQRMMPPGMQVYPSPITLPRGEVTAAALSEMLQTGELEQASVKLKWTGVDFILFACTSGSLVHGIGWDRQLSERIERAAGIPASTTTTAVLAALRAIEATRLAIATPYIEKINDRERKFFDQSGFEVVSIAGLGCHTDREIGCLGPDDARDLVARVDTLAADALFISCTNFHVVEIIEELERKHGKPVITSNQASAWYGLRKLGNNDVITGYGCLMQLPMPLEVPVS